MSRLSTPIGCGRFALLITSALCLMFIAACSSTRSHLALGAAPKAANNDSDEDDRPRTEISLRIVWADSYIGQFSTNVLDMWTISIGVLLTHPEQSLSKSLRLGLHFPFTRHPREAVELRPLATLGDERINLAPRYRDRYEHRPQVIPRGLNNVRTFSLPNGRFASLGVTVIHTAEQPEAGLYELHLNQAYFANLDPPVETNADGFVFFLRDAEDQPDTRRAERLPWYTGPPSIEDFPPHVQEFFRNADEDLRRHFPPWLREPADETKRPDSE